MSAEHVFAALKEIEFDHLIPELEVALAKFRKTMKEKKDRKSLNDGGTEKATEEDADDDEVECIE